MHRGERRGDGALESSKRMTLVTRGGRGMTAWTPGKKGGRPFLLTRPSRKDEAEKNRRRTRPFKPIKGRRLLLTEHYGVTSHCGGLVATPRQRGGRTRERGEENNKKGLFSPLSPLSFSLFFTLSH